MKTSNMIFHIFTCIFHHSREYYEITTGPPPSSFESSGDRDHGFESRSISQLLKLSCVYNCDNLSSLGNSTAAWLDQLVERQSAVREVEGSSTRPDQHSES